MSEVLSTSTSARIGPPMLAGASASAEEAVLAAEAQLLGATDKDTALSAGLIAPEFVNINSKGQFITRAQQVEIWRTGPQPPLTRNDDVRVRIHGDLAIVTARRLVAPDWTDGGVFTRVWFRRDARWQLVFSQYAGDGPAATAHVIEAVSPLQADELTIFQAYRTLRDEFFDGDVDAVQRGTTDDFELIAPTGNRLSKAQVLKALTKRPLPRAEDDVRVVSFGDTALITLRRLPADAPLMRNSFVWVRRGGQWLEASTQQTTIAQPE